MSRASDGSELLDGLIEAGHLVRTGAVGCYGTGAAFEDVVAAFGRLVDRSADGSGQPPRTHLRFPNLVPTSSFLASGFMETMPQLAGFVHSFDGDEREHRALLAQFHADGGDPWAGTLTATELALKPAGCYPLYATCAGALPAGGRTFDLGAASVFRREPSDDPARMQTFRMRELVRLADADTVLDWREEWLERATMLLRSLGLDAQQHVASDPFFGRGGRVMADGQRAQRLKLELSVPIGGADLPRAVASFNYHQDHFGSAFDIVTSERSDAHSACLGFGLERVAIALFWRHGLDPRDWSADVREELWP